MFKALVLLALRFTWPPHVEISTQAGCQVSMTAADNLSPQIAHYWRAYGYVKWEGIAPDGEDVIAKQPIITTDSRKKALLACNDFLEQYDKRMRGRHVGSSQAQ